MNFREYAETITEDFHERVRNFKNAYVGLTAIVLDAGPDKTVEDATGRICSVFIKDEEIYVYLEGKSEPIHSSKIKVIDERDKRDIPVEPIGIRFNDTTFVFEAYKGKDVMMSCTMELFEDIFPLMRQQGGYIEFTSHTVHINK